MAGRSDFSWISSERSRRAKSAVAVAVSFIIVLGTMGFVSWKGYSMYMDWRQQDDYIGNGDQPIEIIIEPGIGWGRVGDILAAAEVIQDPALFTKEALKLSDGPDTPGTYKIRTHLPAATAAAMLNDPKNLVVLTSTIPEGSRLDEILPLLSKEFQISQEDMNLTLEKIQADPTIIGLNGAAGTNLEGYLFPDTYLLHPPFETTATSVLARMASEFNAVVADLSLEAQAQELGLSLGQAVVIASIIEEEVNQAQYRPMVTRAILNRLSVGMPLGVESAFRYGRLMTDGIPYGDPILLSSMRDPNLSYNYYIHSGLPLTPIAAPGRDALSAAVNPVDGDWLYWVTVNLNTGETKFTASAAEFDVFVEEFEQWCAANGNPTGCS